MSIKGWFYERFDKFRIGMDNIINVAGACILAFA
jgi:hypothetical protein